MTRARVGVVGCGDIATSVYLPGFERLEEQAELVAVCDRDQQRAQRAQEAFDARTHYTDLAQFLRESDAEIVVNLTPETSHFAVSLAALNAGRHVYTEKPIAQSVEEADQLISAAREQNVRLSCAPAQLIFPNVRRWQQLLRDDTIGRVTFARAQHVGPPIWDPFPREHIAYFKSGSGPLLSVGVYPLTVLTGLFGPVRRVSATARTVIEERTIPSGPDAGTRFSTEVPDSVHLHLDFADFIAALDVSYCVQASHNVDLEVYGERGTLSGNVAFANAPVDIFRVGDGWGTEPPPQQLPRMDDWFQGVAHLVHCVRHGTEPINGPEHARHVLDVMLTAIRAAAEERSLPLATTFERQPVGDEGVALLTPLRHYRMARRGHVARPSPTPGKRLRGRAALVTGGLRGIGREIATSMAREGADLFIIGKSMETGIDTVREIEALGQRCVVARADVSNEEEVRSIVERAVDELGSLDILVNNAAIYPFSRILVMPSEQFSEVLDVNLKGPWLCAKYAFPALRDRRGSIVNIASTAGHVGGASVGGTAYDASKAGLRQLTASLAAEFGPRQVRVNAISPGVVLTERAGGHVFASSDAAKDERARTPLRRVASPKEIASVAVFLASDDASYITGTTVVVDGGRMAVW